MFEIGFGVFVGLSLFMLLIMLMGGMAFWVNFTIKNKFDYELRFGDSFKKELLSFLSGSEAEERMRVAAEVALSRSLPDVKKDLRNEFKSELETHTKTRHNLTQDNA